LSEREGIESYAHKTILIICYTLLFQAIRRQITGQQYDKSMEICGLEKGLSWKYLFREIAEVKNEQSCCIPALPSEHPYL